jgi:hypothetical protein
MYDGSEYIASIHLWLVIKTCRVLMLRMEQIVSGYED